MVTIAGISGSLRKGSFNTALLKAAADITPEIRILSIRDIPLYDADVEAQGLPDPVRVFKDQLAACDALLLVSPEYNNSMPGVLKNAIDWASRPPSDLPRVLSGKKVGIIGATPGRGGTRFSQTSWLQVFRGLSLLPWFGRELYLDQAGSKFDAGGRITDPKTRELLEKYVKGFVEFCKG